MKVQFTRVWHSGSGFEVHVSRDVHYACLPVSSGSLAYDGWRVFDISTGELFEEDYATLEDAKAAIERVVGEAA